MHSAEDEKDHADLHGEGFDALFGCLDSVAEFQGQADVAEVDQVKADDEQVIDALPQNSGWCLDRVSTGSGSDLVKS